MTPEPSRHNREGYTVPPYTSKLLVLIAVIVFVLAVAGFTPGDMSAVEVVSAGLALFAASFLV